MLLGLQFSDADGPTHVGRVAMSGGLAQLEWSSDVVRAQLPVDPILYPPEPGLVAARGRKFEGLHGFLADSLPEGWGRLLMRRRLAGLDYDIEDLTPLERLSLVGSQGRGALVFQPETTPANEFDALDLDELAAASAEILNGEEAALESTLADLAGASGGARPKIHVGFDGAGRISVSHGEPASGHEAWIVKFRATNDPVDIGPIEAAYAAMAVAAGLEVSEYRLLSAQQGPGYFSTRRFDRPRPGARLHMVSLAGAIEAEPSAPTVSYDTFLRATQAITRHAEDVKAAYRRAVFNVLASNRDDHARQHSYLMDAQGVWRLAPAYDLTFSRGPGGEHYLAVEGEGRTPTHAHFASLGARHGLSAAIIDQIVSQAREAVAGWDRFATEAGVGGASRRSISSVLADVDRSFRS
ncbi:type II toxin-antitoxin system HipA family toxin [Caulobacter sp. FWC2]|uniref:type II toxin-antitoxin system HipA family toxin n=1 Tax=Caulobacter sp. FWC2 TaxID=69664 RepID=UPI001E509644|nr:type II toxin-antitoxin system HipA family toxin [Caulobacter sp. FWC2]